MSPTDAFLELFDRMPELVRDTLAGLDDDQLTRRVDPDANTIDWLVWHLARVEDDHVSRAAAAIGREEFAAQAYTSERFAGRMRLPFPAEAIGYGMTSADVARVNAPGGLLVDYYGAVHAKTRAFLADLSDDDWGRVVDDAWDPPVTLLVRIASVVNDITQHIGQAAFVRGILDRD